MSGTPTASATRLSQADLITFALTFFSLGVTVQVVMLDAGTSSVRAIVASAVIFSATSQLAYLAVIDAGGTELAGIAAGWVVASRFGILAVSLGQKLPGGTFLKAAAAVNAFDPNVAVAIQQPTPEGVQREFWKTTAAMMIGWFPGILIGTYVGNVLGDTQQLGLDALFPAALLAIIGNLLRRKEGMVAAVAGGLICLVLLPFSPAGLPIIFSVVGVGVALLLTRSAGDS